MFSFVGSINVELVLNEFRRCANSDASLNCEKDLKLEHFFVNNRSYMASIGAKSISACKTSLVLSKLRRSNHELFLVRFDRKRIEFVHEILSRCCILQQNEFQAAVNNGDQSFVASQMQYVVSMLDLWKSVQACKADPAFANSTKGRVVMQSWNTCKALAMKDIIHLSFSPVGVNRMPSDGELQHASKPLYLFSLLLSMEQGMILNKPSQEDVFRRCTKFMMRSSALGLTGNSKGFTCFNLDPEFKKRRKTFLYSSSKPNDHVESTVITNTLRSLDEALEVVSVLEQKGAAANEADRQALVSCTAKLRDALVSFDAIQKLAVSQ